MKPSLRQAFVLGAGLGTRLRALTARRPKPLIPLCGKPLITFAFDHLSRYGIDDFIINTHHRPEAYDATFPDASYAGQPLKFVHEPTLLETAGGLKNVQPFLHDETFVIYNGDVLSDLPLDRAIQEHFSRQNEVTLILRSSGAPLHISLDEKSGRVADIAQRLHSPIAPRFMFTGIYLVNSAFLARIPPQTKISVIPIFVEMIQHAQRLGGIVIDDGHWWDLGTRERYLAVHRYFARPSCPFINDHGETHAPWPQWRHPSATIAATAQLCTATAVGAGAVIGERAELTGCVVWENAQVAPDSVLRHCIVTADQTAHGTHTDFDF